MKTLSDCLVADFLYFCTMKRLLASGFLVVVLIFGVISMTMSTREPLVPLTNTHESQQPAQGQHQSFFGTGNLFLFAGMNNEQIRLTHSMQNVSYRIWPSLLNAFRTNHSTLLVDQKFFTGIAVFNLNSAKKQLDGYYLYHLRKLLI